MRTLLLDRSTWDICRDGLGNIAVAANPYAIAQDVASAARTFRAECWYDRTQGIPYWERILGHAPPLGFLKSQYVAAAHSVPEVASARVFLAGYDVSRLLTGQIQVTTTSGITQTLTMGGAARGTGVADTSINIVVDAFGNAARGLQR